MKRAAVVGFQAFAVRYRGLEPKCNLYVGTCALGFMLTPASQNKRIKELNFCAKPSAIAILKDFFASFVFASCVRNFQRYVKKIKAGRESRPAF